MERNFSLTDPMEIRSHVYDKPYLARETLESFERVVKALTELDVMVEEAGSEISEFDKYRIDVSFFERGRYDLLVTFHSVCDLVQYYRAFMDGYEIALINKEKELHNA